MDSETGELLYAELAPFARLDASGELALFVDAIAEPLFEPLHELVSEPEDESRVAWEIALDPDEAPAIALPWLAQLAGARLTPSMGEEAQRAEISNPTGATRGTPAAIIAAVRDTLIGSQTVLMDERYDGNAYALRVRTLAGETPDAAVTEAAFIAAKPGGIVPTYEAVETGDFDDLAAAYTDFDDMATADDFDALALTPPA